jgi:hypothetical protein
VTTCFCGRDLHEGDRRIDATLTIDWGANDQRDTTRQNRGVPLVPVPADWAARRAADHDSRVLTPDNPEFPATVTDPVVDTRTDTLIRKD